MTHLSEGALYVVATPIGNLDDMSARALKILSEVDLVAAEDTRHSARLLAHFDIRTPLLSLHEHNEAARVETLVERVQKGERIALISDAGTPLISDPGYKVVNALRANDCAVVPVPGPCALITALSAAGLPSDAFSFHGFAPSKSTARRALLETFISAQGTQILYESPHRIRHLLEEGGDVLPERQWVLARELTKTFETFLKGTPAELVARLEEDANQGRGEFVVLIAGTSQDKVAKTRADIDADRLLEALVEEGVGVKQSAAIAARLLGGRKKQWYQTLLDRQ
ncbi:16S rRNA (cytidine(1402)-2'-O)-methyltransferase [Larsenimonas salina]|uniref:16S rRNA (cytidine(1402)-2'-O)-methyltransferase n=1 Tax=Larsenimonas salina TaxID=1295565 RepID=UPI0020740C65|nr:16S rRNA (cytidine(1402)-2'-O)-methyltransferase [Larsenimonas salina]MCM5703136.1 16S rRNA (cytidine(1402)-2'-O)-methyltransferase [Larsenimonas salina]